ncbi:hypothetical protein B0H12DRAFT_1232571 [Mycena haematopus]|nr:hypothetical protein B0H12DRAFT_1232571 [Mycena haematopus]
MATSVLQIQELCDYIVDFLHNSPGSLKACALVSRALASSAQYHLFYEVRFGNGIKWNDGGACHRFCAIIASSPHLGPLVQRIQASFTPDVLGQLCELKLPNLRDLVLFRPLKDNIRATNSTCVAYAARLLSFPSIRHVKLQDLVLGDIDNVAQLFQHCTTSLDSLALYHVGVSVNAALSPTPPYYRRTLTLDSLALYQAGVDPAFSTTYSHGTKLKIKTLSFDSLTSNGMWLVHFLVPFNLQELEEVNLGTVSSFLLELLRSSRQSLRKLRLYAQEVNPKYTQSPMSPAIFAQLPSLTHLAIGSLGEELEDVETLLGGLPTPHGVTHLRIEIMTRPPEDRLRQLGVVCAGIGCTVEVILRRFMSRGLNMGDMMAVVRTAFVEVDERERLLVAVDSSEYIPSSFRAQLAQDSPDT